MPPRREEQSSLEPNQPTELTSSVQIYDAIRQIQIARRSRGYTTVLQINKAEPYKSRRTLLQDPDQFEIEVNEDNEGYLLATRDVSGDSYPFGKLRGTQKIIQSPDVVDIDEHGIRIIKTLFTSSQGDILALVTVE